MRRACLLTSLVLLALASRAIAQPSATLFGQEYTVQRFDYFDSVSWSWNGQVVPLHSVEGVVWLGNDRLLLSTEEADQDGGLPNVPENFVVEVRAPRDPNTGLVTGLAFERVVLTQDATPFFLGGWDLNPAGITLNTSAAGIGANGNLIVADGESDDGTDSALRGYSLATGQQFAWPLGSNCLSVNNGKFCELSVMAQNPDIEDVVYVGQTDRIYTLADNIYRVATYTTNGAHLPAESFDMAIGGFGELKGIGFVPNNGVFPAAISDGVGALLISHDDQGPALRVMSLAGALLAFEPLTTDGTPTGPYLLETPDGGLLEIEAVAVDPDDGRLILVNQGQDGLVGNYIWFLTPVGPALCPGDMNCDGAINFSDIDPFVLALQGEAAYAAQYPDCFWLNADTNGDAAVDFADIDPFVARIGGNCP